MCIDILFSGVAKRNIYVYKVFRVDPSRKLRTIFKGPTGSNIFDVEEGIPFEDVCIFDAFRWDNYFLNGSYGYSSFPSLSNALEYKGKVIDATSLPLPSFIIKKMKIPKGSRYQKGTIVKGFIGGGMVSYKSKKLREVKIKKEVQKPKEE